MTRAPGCGQCTTRPETSALFTVTGTVAENVGASGTGGAADGPLLLEIVVEPVWIIVVDDVVGRVRAGSFTTRAV